MCVIGAAKEKEKLNTERGSRKGGARNMCDCGCGVSAVTVTSSGWMTIKHLKRIHEYRSPFSMLLIPAIASHLKSHNKILKKARVLIKKKK